MEVEKKPLRSIKKRREIIGKITDLCKELNIPIEVDLNCYTYPMLCLDYIKLQLAKKQ